MVPVTSSAIRAIGYDSKTQTLVIKFMTGKSYPYPNVPEHVYKEFMSAKSKGDFYNARIKDVYGRNLSKN